MFEQTKALCDHFLNIGIPGFDLIIYHKGKCALRYMGGFSDPEHQIPMNGTEKYHIYSCSKLLTCAAAMQLWEKGLFHLDDLLSDYLPAFREMTVKTENGIQKAKNPIRIHHLFEMTAGFNYNLQTTRLKDFYERSNYRCPTVELINELAKEPLEYEPGEGWKYSLGHDVLAALVEVISGQEFSQYVKEHIFDPLGMEHSDFLHPIEDWNGFARQFRYHEETRQFTPWWKNSYRPGREYASGGAGCVSTVEDYIRFLEAMRTGTVILKKETVSLMATNRLNDRLRKICDSEGKGYGYGLGMRTPLPGRWKTEFGWGGAAGAFASVDVIHELSIFYAQHVLVAPNRSLRSLLYDAFFADLNGETLKFDFSIPDQHPTITY